MKDTTKRAAAFGAALTLLAGIAAPLPANADPEAGKAIFNNNCSKWCLT